MLSILYKFLKKLFGRTFFVILSVLLQILWFTGFMMLLDARYPFFAGVIRLLSFLAVVAIFNGRDNPSYKLAWVLLILSLPIVGFSIYLMFGRSRPAGKLRRQHDFADQAGRKLLDGSADVKKELTSVSSHAARQSAYIEKKAGFPVYSATETVYYPEGQMLYESMVKELEGARHFIFMEYFIIDDGEVWSTILRILEKKAAEGLDVRLIYDDMGCVGTLPARFYRTLRERGIKCEVYNPFHPVVSAVYNNRDHRKIMVVDGDVGFTGGINLADEYINQKKRFGYWKDTGVMLRGEAVFSFTVMFLQMWSMITGEREELAGNVEKYRPGYYSGASFEIDGFVQPYSDSPLDKEPVGESVYLDIINHATDYVWIFTPYLVIDNEMMTALCLAAKSGVDVRIVTPGIPDKKVVFLVTRSYYEQLLDAGVRIFEYQPGFLHAKCFVSDDRIATVGSINLDYRSFNLSFECGVWMYKSRAVPQVKEDALQVFSQCREILIPEVKNVGWYVRAAQSVIRLISPMM